MKTNEFIVNKYSKWYANIIAAAQVRSISGYSEKHHIIPKALGGDNSKANLVRLTAKEHFICHRLLPKMTCGMARSKMLYAQWSMLRKDKDQARHIPNSATFQKIKMAMAAENTVRLTGTKRTAETKAVLSAQKLGARNPMYGTTRSAEIKAKVSATMTGMKKSEEYIKNMSAQRAGEGNPMFGVTHSAEARAKISAAIAARPKVVCPNCSKLTTKSGITRYHGDKCKVLKESE